MKMYYESFKQWLQKSNIVFQGDRNILNNIYKQCILDNISIKSTASSFNNKWFL